MDFSWNDIYQDFLNSKIRKCSEREFQNSIFSVFRFHRKYNYDSSRPPPLFREAA